MIVYVVKSGICLAILFGIYKIFLEKEKALQFNRFYLVSSLLFSFIIPLIKIRLPTHQIAFMPVNRLVTIQDSAQYVATGLISDEVEIRVPINYLLLVYLVITFLFLIRFVRHILDLYFVVKHNPVLSFKEAKFVLITANNTPYTFLNYIFIDEAAFKNQSIEEELFTHELAHVRQKHSWDIIFIELISSFFWFNPLLIWMKKAIQLNHEFLADDVVNSTYGNVKYYQRLLLSKLVNTKPVFLTSNLTFQATKQRFLMMTKQTSRKKTVAIIIAIIPVIAILTVLTCTTILAQQSATEKPPVIVPKTTAIDGDINLKNGDYFVFNPKIRKITRLKYAQLTEAEKQKIVNPQPSELRRSPTAEQLEDWKNPKKFGIWLDGKHVKNSELNQYKPEEIVAFSGSYVHKNARQPQGYIYQFDLMTEAYYQKYVREWKAAPFIIIRMD